MSSPTMPNNNPLREGFRSCNNQQAYEAVGSSKEVIETDFIYQLEIDKEYLSLEEERIVLDALSEGIVTSIHAAQCGADREDNSSNGGNNPPNDHEQQAMNTSGGNNVITLARIDAIASGSFTNTKESCDPHVLESLACNRYEGTVIIGYITGSGARENGNAIDVENKLKDTILTQIADDMMNNQYLVEINNALMHPENDDVKVTRITYEGSSSDDLLQLTNTDKSTTEFDGIPKNSINNMENELFASQQQHHMALTLYGKIAVGLLGVLFVSMIVVFFMMRLRLLRSKKVRRCRRKGFKKEDQVTIVASDEDDAPRHHSDRDDSSFVSIESDYREEIPTSACIHRLDHINEEGETKQRKTIQNIGQHQKAVEISQPRKSTFLGGLFSRTHNKSNDLPPLEIFQEGGGFEDEPSALTLDKRIFSRTNRKSNDLPPLEVFHDERGFEDEPSALTLDKQIRPSRQKHSSNRRGFFRWQFAIKSNRAPQPSAAVEGSQERFRHNDYDVDYPSAAIFSQVNDQLTGVRVHQTPRKAASTTDSQMLSLSGGGYHHTMRPKSFNPEAVIVSGSSSSKSTSSRNKKSPQRVDMCGELMSSGNTVRPMNTAATGVYYVISGERIESPEIFESPSDEENPLTHTPKRSNSEHQQQHHAIFETRQANIDVENEWTSSLPCNNPFADLQRSAFHAFQTIDEMNGRKFTSGEASSRQIQGRKSINGRSGSPYRPRRALGISRKSESVASGSIHSICTTSVTSESTRSTKGNNLIVQSTSHDSSVPRLQRVDMSGTIQDQLEDLIADKLLWMDL